MADRGPESILLCARYGIGDLVMELPALSALREAFPRARITTLAAPRRTSSSRAMPASTSSSSSRGGVVRIGALHLRTTAALLERCRALVCHDTGLMHVAAAVGTPIVGVFGPTRPGVYLPSGSHARSAAPRDVSCGWRDTGTLFPPDCITGGRCLVGEDGCIDRTTLADVLAGLDEVLDAPPRAGTSVLASRERSLQSRSGASSRTSIAMAPNRLLDLAELDRPEVRRMLDGLDALAAAHPRLRRHVLGTRGWHEEGPIDPDIDRNEVKPSMRAFHGDPYTSVGVKPVRT